MNEEVKRDILAVLRQAVPLMRKEDVAELKILSNHTIHNAGVYQDADSIAVSVMIFSFAKILNRPRLCNHPACIRFKEEMLNHIIAAKTALESNKIDEYQTVIKRIFQKIAAFEKKFGMYITKVLQYAKIKRGGRIYEHGLSVGRTAQLLGISRWELMSYLGETKLSNMQKATTVSTKQRLQLTRRLFSL